MKRFFELLSTPILVVPVVLITIWLLSESAVSSQRWFMVFLLNLVFLPVLSVVWLEKKSFVSDLDLKDKHERITFLGLMVLVSIVNFLNSKILGAPKVIQVLNLTVLLLIFTMNLITFIWKISGHMLVLTSMVTIAYFLRGNEALWIYFILPFVAVHRIYFKHHTLAQVIAGFLLGLLLPILVIGFLGLV